MPTGVRNKILQQQREAVSDIVTLRWGFCLVKKKNKPNQTKPNQNKTKKKQTNKQTNKQANKQTKNRVSYFIQHRIPKCRRKDLFVGWLLKSQQHASVSQERICSDNFTCCHTEIEVADPTFYLTQSQYTDTGPTSLSAGPITPGAWQGSH